MNNMISIIIVPINNVLLISTSLSHGNNRAAYNSEVLRQRGATNKFSSFVLLSATYRADRTQMSNRIYFQLL